MGGARWCGKDADVQEVCNHCAACPLTYLLGGCLAVDGGGGKGKSRRCKMLKNLNRGGEKVEKLESRRGRGWKRRSAAPTCQKVHRMCLGPPGSPLDEPINVNSGIGNIGNIGNMGQNQNLPNSQTWILT